MCVLLSNPHGVSLITKVCFHIVLVANAAPGLTETVARRLSFRVNAVMAGFHKCLRWFVMLFPFPKLNESRPG